MIGLAAKKEQPFDIRDYHFNETPKSVKIFFKVMTYLFLTLCCLVVILPLLVIPFP